jgi:DNA mismatch repair protein MutL
VSKAFNCIVEVFYQKKYVEQQNVIEENDVFQAIAAALVKSVYDETCTDNLLKLADKLFKEQFSQQLTLNSVPLDLTSHIEQFS